MNQYGHFMQQTDDLPRGIIRKHLLAGAREVTKTLGRPMKRPIEFAYNVHSNTFHPETGEPVEVIVSSIKFHA